MSHSKGRMSKKSETDNSSKLEVGFIQAFRSLGLFNFWSFLVVTQWKKLSNSWEKKVSVCHS